MTTGQLVVIVILGVLVCVGYFGVGKNLNYNEKGLSGFLYLVLITMIALMSLALLAGTLDSKIKLKDKCPEYEKIENVYKLKEL